MADLNCTYTPDPVCPYCGQVMSDAWEIDFAAYDDTAEVTCGHCHMDYSLCRHVEINYTSKR